MPCPSGTYQDSTGDCKSTPAGFYSTQAIKGSENTVACGNGYLCVEAGSTGPYKDACPVNTWAQAPATTCSACPAGVWCPPGSDIQLDCPLGFYCDSVSNYPVMCPKGTYGATINLRSASDCTSCPAGKTCSQPGLTAPDGDCDAGYFCSGGASTPRPAGGLCPIGAYCPRGTTQAQSCDPGTYNSFPGMRSASDCIPCTQGYYCSGSSNPTPTAQCSAGYYCTGGASAPTQYSAEPGYYTIVGSSQQIQCPAGTFSSSPNSVACTPCTSGKYCNSFGMIEGLTCPAGFFCVTGAINPVPCALGTLNPTAGLAVTSACQPCTPGSYCGSTGLTAVSGLCSAGYFCYSGSPSPTPMFNLTALGTLYTQTTFGQCPQGNYCPAGTDVPIKCNIGFYLDHEGASDVSECVPCVPGYYCNVAGLPSPAG
jgi:hypothetical protein